MKRRPVIAAAMAASALVLTACATEKAADEGAAQERRAAATSAADWLLGELDTDGLLSNTSSFEGKTSTMPDPGASADLVLALSALGHEKSQAAAITEAIAADLPGYVGAEKEVYAGPSAKALTLALDQGQDPRSFGGLDLLARVESTVSTTGAGAGRIIDASEFGDYANTLGQAYAAGALTRAGSARAAAATEFLLAQQCEDGFFRLDLSAPQDADQTCDSASEPSEQSPDVTALVVLQLADLAADDSAVETALESAGDWLKSQQSDKGTFEDPANGVNANSTGLGGWALRVLGEDEAADRAADWLRSVQVASAEAGELAGEEGALAYNKAALEAGRTHGIAAPLDRSQWVHTGVQAFPALADDLDAGAQG